MSDYCLCGCGGLEEVRPMMPATPDMVGNTYREHTHPEVIPPCPACQAEAAQQALDAAVERVARAMFDNYNEGLGHTLDPNDVGEEDWEFIWRTEARAALTGSAE